MTDERMQALKKMALDHIEFVAESFTDEDALMYDVILHYTLTMLIRKYTAQCAETGIEGTTLETVLDFLKGAHE